MSLFFIAYLLLSMAFAEPGTLSEAEILATVQEHAPDRFERLIKLKDRDPERYQEELEKVELLLLQRQQRQAERQAERQALKEEKRAQLQAYRGADSAQEREAIRAEMEARAVVYLTERLEWKRARLEAARARLEAMEAELEAQEATLEEQASQKVEALLRAQGLL